MNIFSSGASKVVSISADLWTILFVTVKRENSSAKSSRKSINIESVKMEESKYGHDMNHGDLQ